MSALMTPATCTPVPGPDTVLDFAPAPHLHRSLRIARRYGNKLHAALYSDRDESFTRMLAWSSESIEHCRLDLTRAQQALLWIGSAAFDLSLKEAAQVEETFGPLGLEIERKERPS